MDDKLLKGMFLIVVFVSLCFGLGLAARFGAMKRAYITRGIPGVYPRNTVYALIPLGIFFLYLGVVALIVGEQWPENTLYFAGAVGLLGLILLSLIWQPGWLKPYWLQWLEEHYGHVLEEIFEEARQMGAYEWEAQVRTQADLEQWADQVARKYGWQRLR